MNAVKRVLVIALALVLMASTTILGTDFETNYSESLPTYNNLGIPVVNIVGSMDGISKENKVTVKITYDDGEDSIVASLATMKWQGNSSINYPKKNYTLQFVKEDGKKNKLNLIDRWGEQSKYCLKANWIDCSHSRNVVSGRIFNQIVKSRNKADAIGALFNGGVVDGYPVVLYHEGDFMGLYTLNIPKDKWMFGMGGESLTQAVLAADDWSDSVLMKKPIANPDDVEADKWDLEYCSTEDNESVGTQWVAESMNQLINFVINNDGGAFRDGIGQFVDIDRSIDVLIYTYFIHANDNVGKNINWATYDGVKWIPSMYDMDGTWGLYWHGYSLYNANSFMPGDAGGRELNLFFKKLLQNYPDEIRERYWELRETILTENNLKSQFDVFFKSVPQDIIRMENSKWTSRPGKSFNNQTQINRFIVQRINAYDAFFKQPEKLDQQIKVDHDSYSLNTDTSPFNLNATAVGELTYSSGNTGVVTVNNDGNVTVKGVGSTTITITAAETDKYNAASRNVRITVTKAGGSQRGGLIRRVITGLLNIFNSLFSWYK